MTTLRLVLLLAAAVAFDAIAADGSKRIGLAGVRGLPGVPTEVVSVVEASFDAELRKLEGVSFVSSAELSVMLGVERQKQLLGSEPGAAASLLVGIDARDVVAVEVAARSAKFLVTARRIVRGGVSQVSAREVDGTTSALAEAASPIVAALFPELKRRGSVQPDATPSVRPIRVAVLDVRGTGGIPPRALAALNQSLTPELRKLEGVSAIASSELADMLGIERQKQLVGCSDGASSCMEELAGALDADELLTVDLTLVGQTYALTTRRTDLRKSTVVQTHLEQFDKRDGEELLAIIGPAIAALYPERPLKAGRTRGVEPALIRRLNPPPLPRWAFAATTGLAAATALAGSTFAWISFDAQRDFAALGQRSLTEPVRGADLIALRAKSISNATTANVLFVTAGGLALAAIVEAFFTDWKDDRAAFSAQPVVFIGGGGGLLFAWTR